MNHSYLGSRWEAHSQNWWLLVEAVAVDIQLVNPLDDVVVFEVALTGDGLLGEAEFVLAPKETATYELVGIQDGHGGETWWNMVKLWWLVRLVTVDWCYCLI